MKRNLTPSDIPALVERIPQLKNYSLDEIDFGKSYVGDGWAWVFSRRRYVPRGYEHDILEINDVWHLIGAVGNIEELKREFWYWCGQFRDVEIVLNKKWIPGSRKKFYIELGLYEDDAYYSNRSDSLRMKYEHHYNNYRRLKYNWESQKRPLSENLAYSNNNIDSGKSFEGRGWMWAMTNDWRLVALSLDDFTDINELRREFWNWIGQFNDVTVTSVLDNKLLKLIGFRNNGKCWSNTSAEFKKKYMFWFHR